MTSEDIELFRNGMGRRGGGEIPVMGRVQLWAG